MSSSALLLRARLARLQNRNRQRGSALFIVVMVVTLLSAVGLYAMGAASLANQAIGFNRLGMRTFYAAEFGTRVVASHMSGREQEYAKDNDAGTCMNNIPLTTYNTVLTAAGSDTRAVSCKRKEHAELFRDLDFADVGSADAMMGQLSHRTPMLGTFDVEITDVFVSDKPVPGNSAGNSSASAIKLTYKTATVTTTALIRPPVADDSTDAAILSSSTVQQTRATVLFGPVPY